MRLNVHDDLKSATAVNNTHTMLTPNDGMAKLSVLGVKTGGEDWPIKCGALEHLDGHVAVRAWDVQLDHVIWSLLGVWAG